ncbi:MAG TPA: tail fiber protein [Acidimicrobiales bacterium]|nr:tail fiber protein [Acidimicrobiales bacterium]
MSSPFVAEIRIFACNFAPTGWALCNGQLMPISQNTALFSLLGTTYGGDGKSTFALPDLEGRVPIHTGGNQPGPGLSTYDLGQTSGTESVTLLTTEMPFHNHGLQASTDFGNNPTPANYVNLARTSGATPYAASASNPPLTALAPQSLTPAGSSLPHNNMMPYLTLTFCIALQGVFPPRG